MTTQTVTLRRPVTIDGRETAEITLREPTTGDLRGLKLTEVLQGSAAAIIKLVPRISTPPLSEAQVAALSMHDVTALFGGIMGFLTDGAPTEMPEI